MQSNILYEKKRHLEQTLVRGLTPDHSCRQIYSCWCTGNMDGHLDNLHNHILYERLWHGLAENFQKTKCNQYLYIFPNVDPPMKEV